MKIELSQQELKQIFCLLLSPSISVKRTDDLQNKIISVLSHWHSIYSNKLMPQWKLLRTLRYDKNEVFPVLKKMQEDGLIEFQRITRREDGTVINGRPNTGYKLC
jgi:DNA-binding PadR family transcriptional regulator